MVILVAQRHQIPFGISKVTAIVKRAVPRGSKFSGFCSTCSYVSSGLAARDCTECWRSRVGIGAADSAIDHLIYCSLTECVLIEERHLNSLKGDTAVIVGIFSLIIRPCFKWFSIICCRTIQCRGKRGVRCVNACLIQDIITRRTSK